MFNIRNLEENSNIKITESKGAFKILEHQKDMSVTKDTAQKEFYASQMNVKRKQILCDLSIADVNIQSGAMQWMVGDVNVTTGVKGAGDFIGKMFKGAVTNESTVKPEYTGDGIVVLEPTYKHVLLIDVDDWNGSIVVEDGMYLASETTLKQKLVARSTISSAVLGGEGLFNISFNGRGIVALESEVPLSELIKIELNNDILKIDGNMAVAWSSGLKFTVERVSKSLIGSAATGEGLVNIFQGTGTVLMAPIKSPKLNAITTSSTK